MKFERKSLAVLLAAMIAASCATGAPGQYGRASVKAPSLENSSQGRHLKEDRLLGRFLSNPSEAPEDLREAVISLRESQRMIRDAWTNDFRHDSDASPIKSSATRLAFQEAYAEEIKTIKELKAALAEELRAEGRERIDESRWSDEAKALHAEYREGQLELSAAWKISKAKLKKGATREEIAAAGKSFRELNQDLIARQKDLGQQVRELVRSSRAEKENLQFELLDLRREMMAEREQIRFRQHRENDDLRTLSEAERQEVRSSLLMKFEELQQRIKERRQQGADGRAEAEVSKE